MNSEMQSAWQGDTRKAKDAILGFLWENFPENHADADFAHEDDSTVLHIPDSKTQCGFQHPVYVKFLLLLNKQEEFRADPL